MERTQPCVTRVSAFTGTRLVSLLCLPNGPTANRFQNWRLVDLNIPPFKNGRLDQRRQPGNIEDIPKREIRNVTIDQDVGGRELGYDWDAVRDEREINQITLVGFYQPYGRGYGGGGGLTKAITSFAK